MSGSSGIEPPPGSREPNCTTTSAWPLGCDRRLVNRPVFWECSVGKLLNARFPAATATPSSSASSTASAAAPDFVISSP
jgi:hypothetical protein